MYEYKRPQSWEIVKSIDEELELIFYNENQEVLMSLSLDSGDTLELLGLINNEVIVPSEQADNWSLRIPDENKELIVLTTIKANKVISNLPLSKESSLKILDALNGFLGKKSKSQVIIGKNGPLLIGIIIFLSVVIVGGIIAGITMYQQFASQIQSLQQIANSIS